MLSATLLRVLIAAVYTVIPFVGVLSFGWDSREILVLYWFESVAIGLAMIVRIIRTTRRDGFRALALAAFFAVHYGIVMLVLGIVVAALVAALSTTAQAGDAALDWAGILGIVAVAAVMHLALALRGALPALAGFALLKSAYSRVIVLHLATIAGAGLIVVLGLPALAAVLLIVLHALVDGVGLVVGGMRRASIRPDATAARPGEPATTATHPAPAAHPAEQAPAPRQADTPPAQP